MSLLLDSDVTTQSATVTLLLGLTQLTSIPPDMGNRANDVSASSVVMSLVNNTQTASVSYLVTSTSLASASASATAGGSLQAGSTRKGLLVAVMVMTSLGAGFLL